MEFPSRMRYDFLLLLIGSIFVVIPFYFEFQNKGISPYLSIFLFSGGILLIYNALSSIRYDYEIDLELKELNYAKEKYELIKYFSNEKLLTKYSKIKHTKDIKEFIQKK